MIDKFNNQVISHNYQHYPYQRIPYHSFGFPPIDYRQYEEEVAYANNFLVNNDYEHVSPCQAHFCSRPNYWYNPIYSSFPINQGLNKSRGVIGTEFLGVVQNGRFRILYPQPVSGFIKLTKDSMNVGRPIVELNLKGYEGKVMLVSGDYRGDWIYQVKIIEEAGPILTIITKQLFNVTDDDV